MKGSEDWNDDSDRVLKVSYEVDLVLARLPEKLTNLENLSALVLSGESDIKADDVEDGNVSANFIEKASAFHLLFSILILELKDLDSYLNILQQEIVDALHTASAYVIIPEFIFQVMNKLSGSNELLRRSQERVLQMNIQLIKMEMTSLLFRHHEKEFNWSMRLKRELQLASAQVLEDERRRALRMLEICLLREMELEKILCELKQIEEDLRLKTRFKEQVSAGMEEAAEVAWTRFLEADNAAEVWKGVSKEMLKKIQSGMVFKLATESQKPDNVEVIGLKNRIAILEEKLGENESKLEEAKVCSNSSQVELKKMGDEIASLRESLFAAKSREAIAVENATQLTESNLELTEELDFLKGSNDNIEKKASLLQKQVREFDIQLQHAKASSEANQEQQNMLYSAIFDMETLIDELKQKVSKAELNAENAEERCIILSETNSQLSKELDFLRSRIELTQTSLDQVSLKKESSVLELSRRSTIIMDMAVQLAIERERIHVKLNTLTQENKLLRESLLKEAKNVAIFWQNEMSEGATQTAVQGPEIPSKGPQVPKTENETASSDNNREGSSGSPKQGGPDYTVSLVGSHRSLSRYIIYIAIVLLLSLLVARVFYKTSEKGMTIPKL